MKNFWTALSDMFHSLVTSIKDPQFIALLALVLMTLLSGTIVYHYIEGWTFLDSFYFTVITITTVGHGSLEPQSIASQIFTIFYLFWGLGIFLGFVTYVAGRVVRKQ